MEILFKTYTILTDLVTSVKNLLNLTLKKLKNNGQDRQKSVFTTFVCIGYILGQPHQTKLF
jgi:hypothetical protein